MLKKTLKNVKKTYVCV